MQIANCKSLKLIRRVRPAATVARTAAGSADGQKAHSSSSSRPGFLRSAEFCWRAVWRRPVGKGADASLQALPLSAGAGAPSIYNIARCIDGFSTTKRGLDSRSKLSGVSKLPTNIFRTAQASRHVPFTLSVHHAQKYCRKMDRIPTARRYPICIQRCVIGPLTL